MIGHPFSVTDRQIDNLVYELYVSYEQTLKVKPGRLRPLENKVIVLHGDTVDSQYIASLPIACGQLRPTN